MRALPERKDQRSNRRTKTSLRTCNRLLSSTSQRRAEKVVSKFTILCAKRTRLVAVFQWRPLGCRCATRLGGLGEQAVTVPYVLVQIYIRRYLEACILENLLVSLVTEQLRQLQSLVKITLGPLRDGTVLANKVSNAELATRLQDSLDLGHDVFDERMPVQKALDRHNMRKRLVRDLSRQVGEGSRHELDSRIVIGSLIR